MISQEHIDKSIEKALRRESNLTPELLNIRGFSTQTMRHFFNNLCNIKGTYLECGLFCGGTFCSSFNPELTSIGVEDYSQDFSVSTVKEELNKNVEANSNRGYITKIYYEDCFKINLEKFNKGIDIFFFDAEHSEQSQAKALPYFLDNMEDTFCFLVDDYNWDTVREGTKRGLRELKDKINIESEWVLGEGFHDHPIWHNGLAIFLINKK